MITLKVFKGLLRSTYGISPGDIGINNQNDLDHELSAGETAKEYLERIGDKYDLEHVDSKLKH